MLYGVPTKVFNQSIKRNMKRFPPDFMFRLTKKEKNKVVTFCDHLKELKFSSFLPHAFTEHGAPMAANVLNTPKSVNTSIFIIRVFVKLRQILSSHKDLAQKIEELEEKYDAQFKVVFDAIRELMKPPEPTQRKIGFH
jgi:hypothetical protein